MLVAILTLVKNYSNTAGETQKRWFFSYYIQASGELKEAEKK